MASKLPFLNVGCGSHYHTDWINIDFFSNSRDVNEHNLLNGIPFCDNFFEIVYHSHVLEHFSKNDGRKFIYECYRVLKTGGIIRIAIPDLQKIIEEYTLLLSKLKQSKDDPYLNACYDWILLELFDQTVRNKSGGDMKEFLQYDNLMNEDYVIKRCGYEVKSIIDSHRQRSNQQIENNKKKSLIFSIIKETRSKLSDISVSIKHAIINRLLGKNYNYYYQIGKFRNGGEIHQWMYDEHSLRRLLEDVGFKNIKVCSQFESNIMNWGIYELETVSGNIRKPDSLFIEAFK